MAKRSLGFNLSATIREFQKSHPDVSATDALVAVKKAHPTQKIKEGTFKATFYKLAGGGKHKVVKRRKPVRAVAGGGGVYGESIMRAGLTFIRLAGFFLTDAEVSVHDSDLTSTSSSALLFR
jgi:hypothetical protein